LIDHFKGRDKVVTDEVRSLLADKRAAISVITITELLYFQESKIKRKYIKSVPNQFTAYGLNEDISQGFIRLVHESPDRSSRWISDALISATAQFNGLEFYTLNRHDFIFISGLKLCKLPYTP